jgi:hypothetical protein
MSSWEKPRSLCMPLQHSGSLSASIGDQAGARGYKTLRVIILAKGPVKVVSELFAVESTHDLFELTPPDPDAVVSWGPSLCHDSRAPCLDKYHDTSFLTLTELRTMISLG